MKLRARTLLCVALSRVSLIAILSSVARVSMELPEKLVADRQAEYLGYFFHFGKFTPSEVAHYVKAYSTPAQLHAAFEMYRAFPANEKFNQAQS